MTENKLKKVSIVIPIYNEGDNILNLYTELKNVMSTQNKDYEIIFVDDCSQDSSMQILEELFNQDERVSAISLLGNQGQTSALTAGFKIAAGDIVIAMDGDGQHNPAYIPQFISALDEGYDIVSSWKEKDESSNKITLFLSKTAHKIIGKFMGVKMKYFAATMKAYRKDVLQNLDLSGDLHRFAGALIHYKGIKIKEIPIEIRKREKGKSNYKLGKIFRVALDLILIKFLAKYSKTPFRIFGSLGVMFILLGLIGSAYVMYEKYILDIKVFYNSAALIVSAFSFVMGLQFIFFGLMAELISRVYYTSDKKTSNLIRTKLRR